MYSIAIFGGTFDPVHNGHIQTSLAIQEQFHFNSYRFIPCKAPAIKPPSLANTDQRITMLKLAIKNHSQFEIDLREIERDTPSYMVETLQSIRRDHKEASITLILGYDAFVSLPQWYQWEEITKLAHLLVINRDAFNIDLPEPITSLLQEHQVRDTKALLNQAAGVIYQFNAGNYPISSTQIRTELKKQADINSQISQEIYDYIKLQGLYR